MDWVTSSQKPFIYYIIYDTVTNFSFTEPITSKAGLISASGLFVSTLVEIIAI